MMKSYRFIDCGQSFTRLVYYKWLIILTLKMVTQNFTLPSRDNSKTSQSIAKTIIKPWLERPIDMNLKTKSKFLEYDKAYWSTVTHLHWICWRKTHSHTCVLCCIFVNHVGLMSPNSKLDWLILGAIQTEKRK